MGALSSGLNTVVSTPRGQRTRFSKLRDRSNSSWRCVPTMVQAAAE